MSGAVTDIPPPDPKDAMAPQTLPERPQKKRRRPALACEQCRKRKIKCDRTFPCQHCVKSGIPQCTYAPTHIPASRKSKGHAESVSSSTTTPPPPVAIRPSVNLSGGEGSRIDQSEYIRPLSDNHFAVPSGTSSAPSLTAAATPDSPNVDWLIARVHHLEDKLEFAYRTKDSGRLHDDTPVEAARANSGTVSKTRYFGRSHWMNGATLLPFEVGILGRARVQSPGFWPNLIKCKALGRKIKETRFKPLSTLNLGKQIPHRELADSLIEAYLRTTEGVFRIVHIPTFRAEYERYWQNPDAASDYFVMQMQLCMAIGSPLQDDKYKLRNTAAQWIYEAHLWLMLPPEKSRMTIAGIQVSCLLVLARTVCAVGQDLVWVPTGGLVRMAMYMGLHRDPRRLADMTTYRAEMRRRLWATIMELNLQASFDAGGAPLISPIDYDTLPPANIDDDQLSDEPDGSSKTALHAPEAATQMSIQLALLSSLPLRLSVLKHANDFRANDSYDETLRFNSELTKACRRLSQSLTILSKSASPCKPNSFHTSMAELLLYRCFHTLHQPVIARSIDDPKFYFSRKMYLDGGLKVAHICGLSGQGQNIGPGSDLEVTDDLYKLVINGGGLFRNVPVQSMFAVVLELVYKSDEQSVGLGYLPAIADYDLKAALLASRKWCHRRIKSGETNIKGYCFISSAARHVAAIEAGLDQTGIEAEILKGAEDACSECLIELKAMAIQHGVDVGAGEDHEASDMAKEAPPDDGMLGMMSMDWMGDWQWDDMPAVAWEHQPTSFFGGL